MMAETLYRTALAAELEGFFVPPTDKYYEQVRAAHTLINDPSDLGQPNHAADVRSEMLEYYRSLRPASDEEAERRDAWLGYVKGDLTLSDVVNFRIYRELSEACLTYATYPVGTTYSDITKSAGMVEFRGPGIHQDGWYDAAGNLNVSEIRMAPTPGGKFRSYKAATVRRIGDIASQEGCAALLSKPHVNGSVYKDEAPLLGGMANLEPYKAVVVGLEKIFREGGLLDPAKYPKAPALMGVTGLRTHVRISPGRFEFRGMHRYLSVDYDGGGQFLNAALLYGSQYSTKAERDKIDVITSLAIEPVDDDWKNTLLALGRTIESCVIPAQEDNEEGRNFTLLSDFGYLETALETLADKKLQGQDCKGFSRTFFGFGIELTNDGFLQTNDELMASVLRRCPGETYLTQEDVPSINAKLRRFHVAPTRQIYHVVKRPGITGEVALSELRSASAFPLVAPEDHAELVANFQGK